MMRLLAFAIVALGLMTAVLWPAAAPLAQASRAETEAIVKDYLATHPDEIEGIVRRYLIKNPEILRDMFIELMKRRAATQATAKAQAKAKSDVDRRAAIARDAARLFASPHQVVLGNPKGDVTLVEFFDYSCGFCKRALADMMTLIHDDPKLKIVLKEFPILGQGSVDAAHVAVAVRMQDPSARKYLAFHRSLLSEAGPADRTKALAAAKDQALDMPRLTQDMASEEAQTTIAESFALTRDLGIRGTPSYVTAIMSCKALLALPG